MLALFQQLLGGSGGSDKLALAVEVDHLELSKTHLVLGLKIDWQNLTDAAIPIKEVMVVVHMGGRNKDLLRFYPLERFARVLGQRAIQKKPVRPFVLPPGEIHREQIRFISQAVVDVPPGSYTMDVEIKDVSGASYKRWTKIHLENKLKYRRSEEWATK